MFFLLLGCSVDGDDEGKKEEEEEKEEEDSGEEIAKVKRKREPIITYL